MDSLSPCFGAGREAALGRLLFFRANVIRGVDVESPRPRTRVYIDGFNFYYAAFRRGAFTDHKLLDLVRFCEKALPRNDIELVRFFTARLDPSRGRAGQRSRQDAYLEALATLPRLTIHFGEFVEHAKRQRLVRAPAGGPRTAEVWVPEEKGSDVNLASHLLLDAFRGAFDVAVVVSAMPICLSRYGWSVRSWVGLLAC